MNPRRWPPSELQDSIDIIFSDKYSTVKLSVIEHLYSDKCNDVIKRTIE